MSHPEIEIGLFSDEYLERRAALESTTTSIDVLDVPFNGDSDHLWYENLNHDELVEYCEQLSAPLASRILFLNIDRDFKRTDFYTLRVKPESLEWLQIHYGLSPSFVEPVVNISKWAKPGDVFYQTRDQDSKIIKIEGFYRIGAVGGATHVWFSYDLKTTMSTYIISNCPPLAKTRILDCARQTIEQLRRPFVVDGFIANVCTHHLKNELERGREPLMAYERYGTSFASTEVLTDSFQNLHRLSRTWHILHEDFVDFEERLEFLSGVLKTYSEALDQPFQTPSYESLQYLISQVRIWKRWTANYNSRTKIRIDLFFNLANQNDNRTNLEIANTSKSIAASTLRDSSAMTTIAGLTMLFLPGTFVSAIFSMVFFNPASNEKDLKLLPCWWYFPAIAIPLTIAVFAAWLIWHRVRVGKAEAVLLGSTTDRTSPKRHHGWFNGKAVRQSVDPILPVAETAVVVEPKDFQWQGRHI